MHVIRRYYPDAWDYLRFENEALANKFVELADAVNTHTGPNWEGFFDEATVVQENTALITADTLPTTFDDEDALYSYMDEFGFCDEDMEVQEDT